MNIVLDPSPVTDSIIVTATRERAPAAAVGASVTVFTASDIERRGSVLISDLVRETPGVTFGGQRCIASHSLAARSWPHRGLIWGSAQ